MCVGGKKCISKYTSVEDVKLWPCFKAVISNHFSTEIPHIDTLLLPNLLSSKLFEILVYLLYYNGFFKVYSEHYMETFEIVRDTLLY